MVDADTDKGREGGQTEDKEEAGQEPLHPLQPLAGPLGIAGGKPAPLHRQPVESNNAVEFDGKQQDQVEGPEAATPHPVRRGVGPDQFRLGEHHIEMHRGEKKHQETGGHLDQPEGGIAMLHPLPVTPETLVLSPAGGKLP